MIHLKYADLIDDISTCNGTCEEELQLRIKAGEIPEYEAAYVRLYANLKKLSRSLDVLSERLPA